MKQFYIFSCIILILVAFVTKSYGTSVYNFDILKASHASIDDIALALSSDNQILNSNSNFEENLDLDNLTSNEQEDDAIEIFKRSPNPANKRNIYDILSTIDKDDSEDILDRENFADDEYSFHDNELNESISDFLDSSQPEEIEEGLIEPGVNIESITKLKKFKKVHFEPHNVRFTEDRYKQHRKYIEKIDQEVQLMNEDVDAENTSEDENDGNYFMGNLYNDNDDINNDEEIVAESKHKMLGGGWTEISINTPNSRYYARPLYSRVLNWFFPSGWNLNIWNRKALDEYKIVNSKSELKNIDHKLQSKIKSVWEAYTWVKQKLANGVALLENKLNFTYKRKRAERLLCASHRYNSYADIRVNGSAKFFNGGKDYYYAVSKSIENANEKVYIMGWVMSPFVFLRRPAEEFPEYRLDRLLKRKAVEGIKIHIVLYGDIDGVMENRARYVTSYFEALDPNIHALYHTNHDYANALPWSHHDKVTIVDNSIAYIGGIDMGYGRFDNINYKLLDDPEKRIFSGPDFQNVRFRPNIDASAVEKTVLNVTSQPRIGWHDTSVSVNGSAVIDMAHAFETRWNWAKYTQHSLDKTVEYLHVSNRSTEAEPTGNMNVQIVRSLGSWSGGVYNEQSAQNAYINSILEAQHFVFIANQFFVSSATNSSMKIHNRVAEAITRRIIKAHSNKETFRMYILIPALTGSPGLPTNPYSFVLRQEMYYQMRTIYKGKHSIFAQLLKNGLNYDDITKYLRFFSLRTWDQFGDKNDVNTYVTEMIYIHSKMMIVDDKKILVGSANINDRSMTGYRDSETVAIIEDQTFEESKFNGQTVMVSKFARDIRVKLFANYVGKLKDEHPYSDGLSPEQHPMDSILSDNSKISKELYDEFSDPVSESFWNKFNDISQSNSLLFKKVFRPYMDNDVKTLEQLQEIFDEPGYEYAHVTPSVKSIHFVKEHLQKIQGILIEGPIFFLNESNYKNTFLDTVAYPIFTRDKELNDTISDDTV